MSNQINTDKIEKLEKDMLDVLNYNYMHDILPALFSVISYCMAGNDPDGEHDDFFIRELKRMIKQERELKTNHQIHKIKRK
jgi:hypothetical protein